MIKDGSDLLEEATWGRSKKGFGGPGCGPGCPKCVPGDHEELQQLFVLGKA